jgi:hypothetical protein
MLMNSVRLNRRSTPRSPEAHTRQCGSSTCAVRRKASAARPNGETKEREGALHAGLAGHAEKQELQNRCDRSRVSGASMNFTVHPAAAAIAIAVPAAASQLEKKRR